MTNLELKSYCCGQLKDQVEYQNIKMEGKKFYLSFKTLGGFGTLNTVDEKVEIKYCPFCSLLL